MKNRNDDLKVLQCVTGRCTLQKVNSIFAKKKAQNIIVQCWTVYYIWNIVQDKTHHGTMNLKEQYPVTAHAPNFDFWTGCCETKRCEESKRTLKNPFASRLTAFNTTLKLLRPRITDQWYIVPVKFRFGQNLDFLALLLLPEDQKIGSTLMPTEGLFLLLASIQAQTIVKGMRRNETATIKTVRKKPLRHWCDWGDLVEGSFVQQNVLQRRVSKLLTADKIKQTGATCLEKLVPWNHNIIFD